MSQLTRIVPLAQHILAEVLQPGDTAVDLTAGNGHDTLFLRQCVGEEGTVYSFDPQIAALHSTAQRLQETGCLYSRHADPATAYPPGIHLINAGHELLPTYVAVPIRAVIANLGYLPGGNRHVITRPETTLPALQHAIDLLVCGGRLAVVVYTGHPGGEEEAAAVDQWFAGLDSARWSVLRIAMPNRPGAPFLLIAEKK